jgi:hypothetical protein
MKNLLKRPSRMARTARLAHRRRPCLEALELRDVPSGMVPTPMDQLFLEELNAARANPAAYGASIGVNLSYIAPAPPLAFDTRLEQAATLHSLDMNGRNFFGHVNPDGLDPGQRMSNAGYPWVTWGESIAAGYASVEDALRGLIIDAGIPSLGHRHHLLGYGSPNNLQRQVGIGIVTGGTGSWHNYYTIDTGAVANSPSFLTGVVFRDANANGRYDVGEGLGGVTITVAGRGSVTTFDTGGYSIPLAAGVYTVTASGGSLGAAVTQTVTVGGSNVRLNFNPLPSWTRPMVASALTHSGEYYSLFVTNAYTHYLGRTPAAAEVAGWVSAMQNGLSDERLEAAFIGSPEYIARHGGQGAGWVIGMYHDLLGRTPSQAEVNGWILAMNNGETPQQVAYGFAASPEREGIRVRDDYFRFLGRAPSQAEVNGWVDSFVHGNSNENVVAGFVGSPEYFSARGHGNNTLWINVAYHDVLNRYPGASEVAFWLGLLN